MIDCVASPLSLSPKEKVNNALPIEISEHSGWASSNKLDEEIRSAHFWLASLLLLFFFVSVWLGAGLLTTVFQLSAIEKKNAQLSDVMSDRLAQEANIKDLSNVITTINNWQSEDGYLPHTFTNIATQLSQLGDWTPNVIRWQSKTLELEFVSSSIDLAALITQLEKQPQFSAVNIRPHVSENTWLLEVEIL
jgi:hypothetical protein